jgi:hypothetical protein
MPAVQEQQARIEALEAALAAMVRTCSPDL